MKSQAIVAIIALLLTYFMNPVETCDPYHLNFDLFINNPIPESELKMNHYVPITANHKHHAAYRLESTYHKLKVKADVSGLDHIKNSLPKVFIWMETVLIPAIIEHLGETFSVRERRGVAMGSDTCVEVTVPWNLQRTQDADVLLFFTAEATRQDKFVAWASACQIHPVTGRPNAGQINLNPYFVSTERKKFFDQFATVMHEIYHVIGFANSLFKYYMDPDTMRRKKVEDTFIENRYGGGFKYYIVSPKVLDHARKHFGCSSIKGVPFEDNGGQGSAQTHWEKVAIGNDIMVANTVASPVVSMFTLKLLEDSGWYKINEEMAEDFFWAKDTGCDFINSGKCAYSGHTCGMGSAGTGEGCFYDYTFQARCSTDSFQNQCYFFTGTDFNKMDCRVEENRDLNSGHLFDEKYGFGSRCFNGNLREYVDSYRYRPHGNFCYKARCDDGKINFMVNGKTYYCTRDGEEIKNPGGYHGFIKCPKIKDFCDQLDASCPFDCHMNGRCVTGGKCYCYAGYTGEHCKKLIDNGDDESANNGYSTNQNNNAGGGSAGNNWYSNTGYPNNGWGYESGGSSGNTLDDLVNWASGFFSAFF